MVEFERNPSSESTAGQPRICVVGIGGAGSNVADRITVDRSMNATILTLQTDVRVLNQSVAPKKIQLGAELMRGVGTGGDPDLGREAALYSKERIREALDGHDMVFISVGLGGGTGSGAAPIVAEIAKNTGALVVIFAAIPFTFEGRRRQAQAKDALDRLEKSADALILFDNDRMGELVLGKEGIQKTFVQADQLIGQSVRAVSAMVAQPGLVKLGLADLMSALRVSEGRCLFGFGEAKGAQRGIEAMKRALKSPLIDNGKLLSNARNLLVHIVGGESLTLAEVENVMKQLGRHVPDETQLLFGVSVEPALGEAMTVTLISALSARELTESRSEITEATPGPVQVAPVNPRHAPIETFTPAPEVRQAPAKPAVVTVDTSAYAPPADLFGEPTLAPATPRQKARETAPTAGHDPAPKAKAPTAPKTAPVAEEATFEDDSSLVRLPVNKPSAKTAGFSLASVISGNDGGTLSAKEENARYAPQTLVDVVEPTAETSPIKLPIARVTAAKAESPVAKPPAPAPLAVDDESGEDLLLIEVELEEEPEAAPPATVVRRDTRPPVAPAVEQTYSAPPAFSLELEPELEEEPELAMATAAPSPVAAPAPAPAVAATAAPAQQVTMSLDPEDRGRFNGTDNTVVEGENLDTPTWMRLRRRPGK